MSVKILTCIYGKLWGTEFGGRPSREWHYRWSLLSLLRMSKADFVCYTSQEEYSELCEFFYNENGINSNKLEIKVFDLHNHTLLELFKKYKDYESSKNSDRCMEVQYMKYFWFLNEDLSYDYYYWFDAGLSHCGLIPNKYLNNEHNTGKQYYDSRIFNNIFLDKLVEYTGDKFLVVAKENQRNYWSGTVNPIHFYKHDSSYHVIGGFFGGKKDLWVKMIMLFTKYTHQVAQYDGRLYHEEDIMTLMYRNHPELFVSLEFDTWWHEDMTISGVEMSEHVKENKSFYKILEDVLNFNKESIPEIINNNENSNFNFFKKTIKESLVEIESEVKKLVLDFENMKKNENNRGNFKFNDIPKFLVNLEKRTDRLEKVKEELEYIGWDYEVFKAIETNSHEGITLSTLEIIKIAKERKYPRVMIIEDDIRFMPYAKDLLEKIEEECKDIEFAVFNLSPTLDRMVNKSEKYNLLLDLTNLPERGERQRDIYGHNVIIYDESIYDKLFDIQTTPRPFYYPIDEFVFRYILVEHQSYCPILPIAPQGFGYSNISNGDYNNFYLQTYNWNAYSPFKIPGEFMDEARNNIVKQDKIYKEFYYVN